MIPAAARGVRSALALAALSLTTACGARTGLLVPDVETGVDAAIDAPDALDVTDVVDVVDADVVLRRPLRCQARQVRTRVGSVVSLRAKTDVTALDGYRWELVSQPEGSRAMLFNDGSDVAVITPDRTGTYETIAHIVAPDAPGGELHCPVTMLADPPDPRCPDYAIDEPRVSPFMGGFAQIAVDPVWGDARVAPNRGTDPGGVLLDDPSARVAAFAIELRGSLADAARWEAAIGSATGASPLFVGRAGRSPQGLPLRRTTLRLDDGTSTTSGALRDSAWGALYGAGVPSPGAGYAAAAGFYVEITTVAVGATAVVIVAVAPQSDVDDDARAAGIRVNDLSNGSPIARAGSGYDIACHLVTTTREVSADFLWLVDTSGSMTDDQQRVGRTGALFVDSLRRAAIDFRLGVFQAGNQPPNLRSPGFRWIDDTDANAAQRLARQVTDESYDSLDREQPYRISGGDEEPIAAAIQTITTFENNATAGETNPQFLLRRDASKVAFLVTDEPGTNDYSRFFRSRSATYGSDRNLPDLVSRIANFFTTRSVVPFGLVPYDPSQPCPNIEQLPACVILAAGGAVIPIELADARDADRAFASAMARVTDVVIGASSEFVLPRIPMSASLRTRVASRNVPRSRADGFDYEDRATSLVFRGTTYRPMIGDQVRAAYFYWRD